MPRIAYWDMECTRYFLKVLGARFSHSRGSIPSTAVYDACANKMNERYRAGSYTLDSLRSKFQRMKRHYKIYYRVLTNTGLGWDEKTQTVVAPKELIKQFAEVIICTWSSTIYQFVICLHFIYNSICWLILIFVLLFRGTGI